MILLGLIVVRGPGAFSLDHFLAPRWAGSPFPLAARITAGLAVASNILAPFYAAVLRLWMAALFFPFSTTGITGYQQTVGMIAGEVAMTVGGEETATGLVLLVNFVVPFFLAVGLFTRLAVIPLIVETVVLQTTSFGLAEHVLWMLVLIDMLIHGAGPVSLDDYAAKISERIFPCISCTPDWLDIAPRVVIVGAGQAGIAATLGLRHAQAHVTLIDRRNYHLFQPLLY